MNETMTIRGTVRADEIGYQMTLRAKLTKEWLAKGWELISVTHDGLVMDEHLGYMVDNMITINLTRPEQSPSEQFIESQRQTQRRRNLYNARQVALGRQFDDREAKELAELAAIQELTERGPDARRR